MLIFMIQICLPKNNYLGFKNKLEMPMVTEHKSADLQSKLENQSIHPHFLLLHALVVVIYRTQELIYVMMNVEL